MRAKIPVIATWLTMSFTTGCPLGAHGEIANTADQGARLNQLSGLKAGVYGPNCWNAVLASLGFAQAPRAVTKPELWHWLNSDHCRRLSPEERPQRGDIGSLFWKSWGNYHSYIYIDRDTVFSKNGPDPHDIYRFQKYEEMFRRNYQNMAHTCKDLTSKETLDRPDCEMKTVYHRCRPVPPDFYQKHNSLRETETQVTEIEKILTLWLLNPSPNLKADLERGLVQLTAILKDLRQRRHEGELEFARKSLEYRVIGLLMSDSFSIVLPSAREGEDMADQIQQSERGHVPGRP